MRLGPGFAAAPQPSLMGPGRLGGAFRVRGAAGSLESPHQVATRALLTWLSPQDGRPRLLSAAPKASAVNMPARCSGRKPLSSIQPAASSVMPQLQLPDGATPRADASLQKSRKSDSTERRDGRAAPSPCRVACRASARPSGCVPMAKRASSST